MTEKNTSVDIKKTFHDNRKSTDSIVESKSSCAALHNYIASIAQLKLEVTVECMCLVEFAKLYEAQKHVEQDDNARRAPRFTEANRSHGNILI